MDATNLKDLASYPTSILFSIAFVFIVYKYAMTLPKIMAGDVKAIENNTAAIQNNTAAMEEIKKSQQETSLALNRICLTTESLDGRMQKQEEKTDDLINEVSEIKEVMLTRKEFNVAQTQTVSMISGRLER